MTAPDHAAPLPSPAPRPPSRRRGRRWLAAVGALIVFLLAAAGGGLAWVMTTTGGAAWALRTGVSLAGGEADVQRMAGSLADGLSIGDARIGLPDLDVELSDLRLEVAWRALWHRELRVRELSVRRLALALRGGDDTPSPPLASLRMPIDVTAERVRLGTFTLTQDGAPLPVQLGGLDAALTLAGSGHRLVVHALALDGADAHAALEGEVALGVDKPFATTARLAAQGRQAERGFTLEASARGTFERLDVAVAGSGAGTRLDAQGRLALLGGFPVRALRLRLEGLDPAAWVAGAPRADLAASADLAVDAEAGEGAPSMSGPRIGGPFSVTNRAPAALDAGGLPLARIAGLLGVPADTFDQARVTGLDIALAGGGRLSGEVAWQGSEGGGKVEGRLQAVDVDAARIHGAAVPTRLAGPLVFRADASSQAVEATLTDRQPGRAARLQLAATQAEGTVEVSRLELAAGDATLNARGSLGLEGDKRFAAELRLQRFDPAYWLRASVVPPALLSAQADVRGRLAPRPEGVLDLAVAPGSRWNAQPLGGKVHAAFAGERLSRIDANLTVGTNRLHAEGAYGRSGDRLRFDAALPVLAQLWPGLAGQATLAGTLSGSAAMPALSLDLEAERLAVPGGVRIARAEGRARVGDADGAARKGGFATAPADIDLRVERVEIDGTQQFRVAHAALAVDGTMAAHRATLEARVAVDGSPAPVSLAAAAAGGWAEVADGGAARALAGWRGELGRLVVSRDPWGVRLLAPLPLRYVPQAPLPGWQWEAGATEMELSLADGQKGRLVHRGSRGTHARWESDGEIKGLAWSPALMIEGAAERSAASAQRRIVADARWALRFDGALAGDVTLQRRSGDLWLPGAPPVAVGLQRMEVRLQAQPTGAPGASSLVLDADIEGTRLGRVSLDGQALLVAGEDGWSLARQQPALLEADLDIKDLAWLGLFVGEAVEIGGQLSGKARVTLNDGDWSAGGALEGRDLKVLRIDDGLRLIDGTLRVVLDDDRITLESLRFPGVIRVRPRDSRIESWIAAEGGKGDLTISAFWNLTEAAGHATVIANKFPAIQRTDRFVVGSGRVDFDLAPKKLRVAGLFEADAGWINLGKDAPPSLSDDVRVVDGREQAPREPMGIAVDVGAKLGDNFYLQGYGLDTGVTGALRLVGRGSALTASGTLRTRGGRFSAYGQTLTVRRGVLSFQGPIDDPLLDIVALRVGPRVEAGVQVGGTARRPRIALFSEPQVSDVEKLSWLLLGRGPDDGGNDAGLLLSAAASLLGPDGGEPLSRQLGVDELGFRTGAVGSSRGLLPERTVAGDSTSSSAQLASQFLVVGKRLSDAFYVSFEQALSGRDGVVKLSYRLTRQLSVVAKGGTLNGLDLLYYVLFDD